MDKFRFPFVTFTLALLAVHAAQPLAPTVPASSVPVPATRAEISARWARLPLSFEAAGSQTGSSSAFLARGRGYSIRLQGAEADLVLGEPKNCTVWTKASGSCAGNTSQAPDLVRMTLKRQNPPSSGVLAGEDSLPGKVNYLIGGQSANWRTGIATYAKVREPNAYPGIDLVYYGNQRQLEFDFVVAPGAQPSSIQLGFAGQQQLRIAANGDLILKGVHGAAAFHKPLVYQEIDGRRVPVSACFRLADANTVAFRIGRYDRARPLIIDPVLVYSTFLGSNWSDSPGYGDSGNGIAVDAQGSVYVIGATYGIDFPTTAGALQTTNAVADTGHGSNVFISKFNATGTALEYSTYLGGTGQANANPYAYNVGDFGTAVAIDASGDAYLTGWTYSPDFPTTKGALQTVNRAAAVGFATAFVSKLNPAGNALLYSTFLGGVSTGFEDPLQTDAGKAIAIDSAGNAYVAGFTRANNFPVTPGSYETSRDPSNEYIPAAFVSKLNPQGSALVYSTYLGGYGCAVTLYCGGDAFVGDEANSIAIDSAGDAYVAGSTFSDLFPTTKGAYQTINHATPNGGANAFVTKLNPAGTALLYSTFLGGSAVPEFNYGYLPDIANSIATDSMGNAYIAGFTASTDFPVTPGALGPAASGLGTGFITKLNPTGSALTYSTFLGGDQASANAVAVDSTGIAYVAGSAVAGNLLLSSDAVSNIGGAFVAKVKPDASGLDYATLLGGSGSDQAFALALGSAGLVYVTGQTSSSNFPITSGAFQTKLESTDAFVTELDLSQETDTRISTLTTLSASALAASGGQSITLTASVVPTTGTSVATGQVAFSGQVCSKYQRAIPANYWTNCTAITAADATLNSAGVATLTLPALKDGTYSYIATYLGDTTHSQSATVASASPLNLFVSGPPVSISGSTVTEDYGAQFPIDVALADAAGYPMAGYTINGVGHGIALQSPSALTDATGVAYFNATAVAAGTEHVVFQLAGASLETVTAQNILRVPLTIQLRAGYRLYGGDALPAFNPIFTGLVNGDTITVTPQTTATVTSPVGTYPVTATAGGPAAANYDITVIGATLSVHPAPLVVEARSESVTYGHTPAPPAGYTLYGFVNGETASIVTGQPVLSTDVTATSPVGFYPIGVGVGTLAAPNYYFKTVGNGMGAVGVYKALLTLTPANRTIHRGSPIPAFSYALTGFVNGDTAATAVTGSPILSTAASSSSPPGRYYITAASGTLGSQNYGFSFGKGILTILP